MKQPDVEVSPRANDTLTCKCIESPDSVRDMDCPNYFGLYFRSSKPRETDRQKRGSNAYEPTRISTDPCAQNLEACFDNTLFRETTSSCIDFFIELIVRIYCNVYWLNMSWFI